MFNFTYHLSFKSVCFYLVHENFGQLLEKSLSNLDVRQVVLSKVVDIQTNQIIVDACSKAESFIPISEFQNSKGEIDISVGDDVDVFVEAQENSDGNIRLSYEKAKKEKVWKSLEDLLREEKNVKGVITERVKGGFIVDLEYIKAFLPGSLVDIRPVKDPSYLEGE